MIAYHVPDLLLWLFVINQGVAFGAGLYEQRIILPQWFSRSSESGIHVNGAAMRDTDTGRRFWAFVTTVPLTLLTLANLPVAWQSHGPRHQWWLGAVVIALAERIATFSYFIPTALRLMRAGALPSAQVAAMASRWMALNYVRAALTLMGWLAALKALSLSG
jgi:magnesium-transporting ATPase (P-type)